MTTQTWEINRTTYKVSDFVSWQKAGTLVLAPKFQRRPVWKPGAKSLLIDTVVRGFPMPIVFLREQRTDLKTIEAKREVVDGQQRIRTLLSFIDPSLLPDYNAAIDQVLVKKIHNSELAKKKFSDLSSDLRQRILDYQFSVHVLPTNVDDREVIQLFARMNATGVQLNPQELRNAEWFGEFKTAMYVLGTEQLQRWRDWKIFDEYNIARMQEVELVSEFAILAIKGLTGKTQRALDTVYKEKDEYFPEQKEFERRFRLVMESINDHLGKDMPFLSFRNKTLFYSLFAFLYDVEFGLKSALKRKTQSSPSSTMISWIKEAGQKIEQGTAPKTVLDAAARRTTHISSRQRIFDYLKSRK